MENGRPSCAGYYLLADDISRPPGPARRPHLRSPLMRLYDLTLPLSSATVPWPGDIGFTRTPSMHIADGASVNLSSMAMSLHNGTHADAPWHFDAAGVTMDQVPLEPYLGPAVVVEAFGCEGEGISATAFDGVDLTAAPRVLLKTAPQQDRTHFPPDFAVLTPEAVARLAAAGVRLVGVDVPSVDKPDSKTLPNHHALGAAGIFILENLHLGPVPPGRYELIALPLAIVGGDGSPVRAVLREI